MFLAALLAGHFVSSQGSFTIIRPWKQGNNFVSTKEDLSQPALEIKGDNKTIDMKGMVFRGSDPSVEPDQRKGLGVRISGNNLTIKNLNVHGYKVALWAENCKNLKLIDCDLSYNWKQHLKSTLEKEDLEDWMSFHQNEKNEWMRYGAGAYFKNVNGFEVKNTKIVGGQCGLMLMNSNNGLVWNNNFSFLSGIGLGMYRSSNNRIMHNNIDWCVRGYSDGVYNRGQDSAGILIYEQSNKNTFAYNSVTHGGDGFFLWAGQSTMDTAKGGCNDNVVYGNDFSHAPTNGI
ncbi:MAG: right-handed parallel beta-helix repeat-containing protein, partial [Armatimonadota bacterium]